MKQLKIILQKLKNPSVLFSILSQIIAILLLLEVNVNISLVVGVVTAIGSVLSLLGLLHFPFRRGSATNSFNDELLHCYNCNKVTPHILINERMTCSKCGCIYKSKEDPLK